MTDEKCPQVVCLPNAGETAIGLAEACRNAGAKFVVTDREEPNISEITSLFQFANDMGWPLPRRRDRLAGVDVDAEYKLIKQKKSKLPAALRAEVVRRVEK